MADERDEVGTTPADEPRELRDEVEQEPEESGSRSKPARYWHDILVGRERPGKVGDLLIEEIELRWGRASVRLKGLLAGRIELGLGDRSHTFQWSSNGAPGIGEGGAASDGATCRIELSENTLLRIAAGELNPQVAMLSDKIKIQGTSGLAVYFFNLIAPRT